METLVGTYAVAASIVGLYAAWIAVETTRLSRRLKQLKPRLNETQPNSCGKKPLDEAA